MVSSEKPLGGQLIPSYLRIPRGLRKLGALHVFCAAAVWLSLGWLSLGLLPPGLSAQTFDATNVSQRMPLAATWLVHAGDDPSYARPDFDDSQWLKFDSRQDLTTVFPHSRPEIVWYRLHVKVLPGEKDLYMAGESDLGLKEVGISKAFEVYTNGVLLMQVGRIQPFVAYTSDAPIVERIPRSQLATGWVVIALRVHISPEEWNAGAPGLAPPKLVLGRWRVLRNGNFITLMSNGVPNFIGDAAYLGLGLVALALFFSQRKQKEYLWLALELLVHDLGWATDPKYLNISSRWLALNRVEDALVEIFGFLVYFAFLGRRIGWRLWSYIAVSGLLFVGISWPGTGVSDATEWACRMPLYLLQGAVVPILLVVYFRRGNREAGILLIPALLWSLIMYVDVLMRILSLFPSLNKQAYATWWTLTQYPMGPFLLSLYFYEGLFYVLEFAIIIVLRSARVSRQQTVLEGELAAARAVQHVILPEQIESIAGFAVECVYKPAREVGGDFFQILPRGDGGLLLVMGDVAGKGLPAAMMVSVIVGAIRATAEFTNDPVELLHHLNERLIGRTNGGFSTALAARITADGSVAIANAGHLPPYLDGNEVGVPGALPLGIVKHPGYELRRFNMAQGSRLSFYTDGVVEAQNQKGELFGFERGRSISAWPAAAIVEEAQRFGQSDDITVVTVERLEIAHEDAPLGTATILASA